MKKFIKIFVILFVSLALVACGNKDEEKVEEKALYTLKMNGVNLTPGEEFTSSKIEEEPVISKIPSCAFEGEDTVYTYSNYEVTVANVDGKDVIYSVYFIQDISTPEGISIGSSKEDVIKAYGEDYKIENNEMIYTSDNHSLSFILSGDTVISIEYDLVVK